MLYDTDDKEYWVSFRCSDLDSERIVIKCYKTLSEGQSILYHFCHYAMLIGLNFMNDCETYE